MSHNADQSVQHLGCQKPHVLVVNRNDDYGTAVVAALQKLSMCAKYLRTVDEFLDSNCRVRVDLVSLEVQPDVPNTLDSLRLLRTHFGEGPGTRIVASTSLETEGFGLLVERHGADALIYHRLEPRALATALATDLRHKFRR